MGATAAAVGALYSTPSRNVVHLSARHAVECAVHNYIAPRNYRQNATSGTTLEKLVGYDTRSVCDCAARWMNTYIRPTTVHEILNIARICAAVASCQLNRTER